MAKLTTLKKPLLSKKDILGFVEGSQESKPSQLKKKAEKTTQTELIKPELPRSGQIPEGDIRLTANIRADLHLKLKIKAAQEHTTIGELIERWVESWNE